MIVLISLFEREGWSAFVLWRAAILIPRLHLMLPNAGHEPCGSIPHRATPDRDPQNSGGSPRATAPAALRRARALRVGARPRRRGSAAGRVGRWTAVRAYGDSIRADPPPPFLDSQRGGRPV